MELHAPGILPVETGKTSFWLLLQFTIRQMKLFTTPHQYRPPCFSHPTTAHVRLQGVQTYLSKHRQNVFFKDKAFSRHLEVESPVSL